MDCNSSIKNLPKEQFLNVLLVKEMLNVCIFVAKKETLKMTVVQSVKGGIIAGSGAFVGAIFLGPLGIGFGGTIGSIIAYKTSKKFKPLYKVIIDDLKPEERKELAILVYSVLMRFDETMILRITYEIYTVIDQNPELVSTILKTIKDFINSRTNENI